MSLVLEDQQRFDEAERLWRRELGLREVLGDAPYVDALADMASFYARRGDFRNAAAAASQVISIRSPKSAKSSPAWTSARPDSESLASGFVIQIAMHNIVGLHRWTTTGAPSAFPFVGEARQLYALVDHGSNADRWQLCQWLQEVAFLQMSTLLDGTPSESNVRLAYTIARSVKALYLRSQARMSGYEPHSVFAARLAEARGRRAYVYSHALLSKHLLGTNDYQNAELTERLVSEAITSGGGPDEPPYGPDIFETLPVDSTLIDFIVWERRDRDRPNKCTSEYGAFIIQRGHAVQFVRLGQAAQIDQTIRGLRDQIERFGDNRNLGETR